MEDDLKEEPEHFPEIWAQPYGVFPRACRALKAVVIYRYVQMTSLDYFRMESIKCPIYLWN